MLNYVACYTKYNYIQKTSKNKKQEKYNTISNNTIIKILRIQKIVHDGCIHVGNDDYCLCKVVKCHLKFIFLRDHSPTKFFS